MELVIPPLAQTYSFNVWYIKNDFNFIRSIRILHQIWYVLLTVHLSIILVTDQLNALNLVL